VIKANARVTDGRLKMTDPADMKSLDENLADAAARTILRAQQDSVLKSVFDGAQLKQIDKWITTTDPALGRTEAIRRLVEIGLSRPSEQPHVLSSNVEGAARAGEAAERKVDRPKRR
jgi:hypothetical protein